MGKSIFHERRHLRIANLDELCGYSRAGLLRYIRMGNVEQLSRPGHLPELNRQQRPLYFPVYRLRTLLSSASPRVRARRETIAILH